MPSATATSILVVDDEPDICANFRDILSEFGYQVDTATSAETALNLVTQNAYDIALLDLKMPGMGGLELCERIQRIHSQTATFIVTAYAGPETCASATLAGARQIVPKPVDVPNLLRIVEETARLAPQ